jgi:hypothetical protein
VRRYLTPRVRGRQIAFHTAWRRWVLDALLVYEIAVGTVSYRPLGAPDPVEPTESEVPDDGGRIGDREPDR